MNDPTIKNSQEKEKEEPSSLEYLKIIAEQIILMNNNMNSMKTELKEEISNMKTELKGEISDMKTELKGMKTEIRCLKESIDLLNIANRNYIKNIL